MKKVFFLYGKLDENDKGVLIGVYSALDKAEAVKRISMINDEYADYYIVAEECDKDSVEKLPFKDAIIGMIKNYYNDEYTEDWFVIKEMSPDKYLFIYKIGGYDICSSAEDADFKLDGTTNHEASNSRVCFLCKAKSFSAAQHMYKNPYNYKDFILFNA